MDYKPVDKLIREYSIAYAFCGNNTKAKLDLTNEFNFRLSQIPYMKHLNFKYGFWLNTAVINAMERVQDLIVRSQPKNIIGDGKSTFVELYNKQNQ